MTNETVRGVLVGDMTPVGTVVFTAQASTANPPSGWLFCNGQSLDNRGVYQNLFGVIGYTYGGSGSNFTLPNLKGKMIVGYNSTDTDFDTVGHTGGSKDAVLIAHTHTIKETLAATSGGYHETVGYGSSATPAQTVNDPISTEGTADSGNQNLPPYIAMQAIIKF